MSQLTHEDDLRLQILLANGVQAVRIDTGRNVLHALTQDGEARITLHPQGRPETYWMRVRECLSGHAMNSPGGYPVYLQRWTRMGQASDRSLPALLCLGEPEAVMAVAHAPGLTAELARRVWWARQDSETARAMLGHAAVRADPIGATMARHLVEFTPFESDACLAMENVRSALAARHLDAQDRAALWRLAQHKPHLQIGFIEHAPELLPDLLGVPASVPVQATPEEASSDLDSWHAHLARIHSHTVQAGLCSALQVLDRPAVPEAVTRLQGLVHKLLGADEWPLDPPSAAVPLDVREALQRLHGLARLDLLAPLQRRSVVGALLRRKLAPTLDPLCRDLKALLITGCQD